MKAVIALLLALLALPAYSDALPAYSEGGAPVNPAVEQRLMKLSEELRCLVCQNQSLADSGAGLAEDLRREIRSMIVQGKTDKEIVDFLVQRYGDFVRYRPPVKSTTVLLWFGPFALLGIGGIALYRRLKQRRQEIVDTPLTKEERARVNAALNKLGDKT